MNKKGLDLDNFLKVEEMHHCSQNARAKRKNTTVSHGQFQPGVDFKP